MRSQTSLGLGWARAAVTLSLVLAGCGSTTADPGAGDGAHAGSSADAGSSANAGSGGVTAGGSASGGGAGGGSSGTGGTASGGSSGHDQSAGAAGRGDGAGGAAGRVCSGYTLDPARANTPQCGSSTDCQGISTPRCQTAPPTYACGGVVPLHECSADLDCGAGRVCNLGGCGSALCADACPTKACASYEDCTSGHCAAKACDAVGALPCGIGTECKSVSGGAASCKPLGCNAGFDCAASWDCAPGPTADGHGCVQRVCQSAADCACGYCVSGVCQPTPGYCFAYAPPP